MGKADFKPCRKLSFDARQSDKNFVLTPKQSFERALCISRCERHPPLEGRDIVLCPMRVFYTEKEWYHEVGRRVSLQRYGIFYFHRKFNLQS